MSIDEARKQVNAVVGAEDHQHRKVTDQSKHGEACRPVVLTAPHLHEQYGTEPNMATEEEVVGLAVFDGDAHDPRIVPVVAFWIWEGKDTLADETEAVEPGEGSGVASYGSTLDEYVGGTHEDDIQQEAAEDKEVVAL